MVQFFWETARAEASPNRSSDPILHKLISKVQEQSRPQRPLELDALINNNLASFVFSHP